MLGGQNLSKIRENYQKKEYIKILLLLLVCVLAFTYLTLINGRIDMNAGMYGNVVLFYINAALGITIVICGSIFLRCVPIIWRLLTFLGKKSIYILMFHVPMASFVQGDILNIMPLVVKNNLWNRNAIGIVYWLCMPIVASLLLGYIWDSFLRKR